MKSFDAVVVGAGPAGGSAAFFLAKLGLRVAIIERGEFPRRKVCGEFVSSASFPLLDAIGIGNRCRADGGPPVTRVGLYGRTATVTASMPPDTAAGAGRTVRRDVLDTLLLDAAAQMGVEVFQPAKAVGIERLDGTSAGSVVTISTGDSVETLRARFVVVAHGSWETGTLPSQPAKQKRSSDLLAFKAYYGGANFPRDLIALVGIPGGYGGMVHRDDETVGFSVCVRREALPKYRALFPASTAGESVFHYAAASSGGVFEALDGAELEGPPLGAGPLQPGIRPGYADGTFRVGNAAGEAHPAIADGLSMAIQSGSLLASHIETILGELDDPRALDRAGGLYAAAWRETFSGRIRASSLYAHACMSPIAGTLLAPILTAFPQLVTLGAVVSGKTSSSLEPVGLH